MKLESNKAVLLLSFACIRWVHVEASCEAYKSQLSGCCETVLQTLHNRPSLDHPLSTCSQCCHYHVCLFVRRQWLSSRVFAYTCCYALLIVTCCLWQSVMLPVKHSFQHV